MSILIKGMEIPKSCNLCPCFNDEYYYCQVTDMDLGHIPVESRRPDCPLIEVPPHGRLIDADVLHKQARENLDFVPFWMMDEAPTVIPADKDGEA